MVGWWDSSNSREVRANLGRYGVQSTTHTGYQSEACRHLITENYRTHRLQHSNALYIPVHDVSNGRDEDAEYWYLRGNRLEEKRWKKTRGLAIGNNCLETRTALSS